MNTTKMTYQTATTSLINYHDVMARANILIDNNENVKLLSSLYKLGSDSRSSLLAASRVILKTDRILKRLRDGEIVSQELINEVLPSR